MSDIVKIYDSILGIINEVKAVTIRQVVDTEQEQDRKDCFIRGLEAAISLIEQEQEFVYSDDYAYEKFEEVLDSYLDGKTNQSTVLSAEDIEALVKEKLDTIYH